jgi:hypothetical protein
LDDRQLQGGGCGLCGAPLGGEVVRPGPAWVEVHRACFEDWDRRDEAAERELAVAEFIAHAVLPAQPLRRRHQHEDRVGQRYGQLLVIGEAVVERPRNGWLSHAWRCRCDCGCEVVVRDGDLRRGTSRCYLCGKAASARSRYGPVTATDIARAAGLSPDTVRKRIASGWPRERLGDPLARPAMRKSNDMRSAA